MNLALTIKKILFPGFDVSTRKRQKFVRYFKKGNCKTIDIGCGNGAFTFAAAKNGNEVLGIDFDAEKLKRCEEFRDFLGFPAEKCRFKVWSVYDADRLEETFDQIICFETLEHLKEDKKAIEIFQRILRPSGILHLCTPSSKRKPYYGEVISKTEDGGHMRLGYTFAAYQELLQGAGFTIIRKDTAVGFFGQLLLNVMNWADIHFLFRAPGRARDAAHFVLFCILYPFTFLDFLIPYPPLNIYVTALRNADQS